MVNYTPKTCTNTRKDEPKKHKYYLTAHFLTANTTMAIFLYSFNKILLQTVHDTGPKKQRARNPNILRCLLVYNSKNNTGFSRIHEEQMVYSKRDRDTHNHLRHLNLLPRPFYTKSLSKQPNRWQQS